MPIIEEERIVRDYPRHDYERGDYLVRDRDGRERTRPPEPRTLAVVTAGSALKTAGGVAVAILAILALIGLIPGILLPTAGIVFGVAMLFEGMGITGEYRKLGRWLADTTSERVELAGGAGVELVVGIATIVLGILALIGLARATLMPVLVIVAGAGLVIAVGTVHRLSDLQLMTVDASDFGRHLHRESMAGAAIAQMLAGVAALVLGILSLIWAGTTASGYGLLAQIAMICLGVGAAIGGGAIAGRSTMIHRRG